MSLSIFLAQIIGVMAVVAALAAWVNRRHFIKAAVQIHRDYALLFSISTIELLLGLAIVLKHPIWSGWPTLITIIGWLMVLEGMLYLFAPEIFTRVRKAVKNEALYNFFVAGSLILGAFFLYQGFIAV